MLTFVFHQQLFSKVFASEKSAPQQKLQLSQLIKKNVSNKIDYDSIKNDVNHYVDIYWK
jgi:hypothetical protein